MLAAQQSNSQRYDRLRIWVWVCLLLAVIPTIGGVFLDSYIGKKAVFYLTCMTDGPTIILLRFLDRLNVLEEFHPPPALYFSFLLIQWAIFWGIGFPFVLRKGLSYAVVFILILQVLIALYAYSIKLQIYIGSWGG